MFIDRVTIEVEAGRGGDGCVSFRREKFVQKGGPDGGKGGNGGDVILAGARNIHTLLDFRWRRIFRAERGGHGKGKNMTGASGKELVLGIPLGTVVEDVVTQEFLGEIVKEGDRLRVAKGGTGGKGNVAYRTSTDRAPTRREHGTDGEKRNLKLELKLIADVGIVGLPNAGKSSLLRRVSRATPKIGDYPFTTTHPNLGFVGAGNSGGFVMADIPGLVEGAHRGKGMGLDFLRHIERTRVLLFLLDGGAGDVTRQYEILKEELSSYGEKLLQKPRAICINKIDLLQESLDKLPVTIDDEKIYNISALTGQGIGELVSALGALLEYAREI
ncbi:MAG: GTPase ObgE [Candidatus Eisenbacteria bacterium]|nr:GTPase ObgE [Candidatus Eisenbacteria bacterium]